MCRFIWWDNCLKRSLSGTNSEDNGWWSDDVSVLGPVLDAGVGLQTIGSFKSFVTILAHVARAGHVCLHMLLHVLLGSVTVATMDANKLSVYSPLKHGMYLLFIRCWIPSWKYTSLLRFVKIETNGKKFLLANWFSHILTCGLFVVCPRVHFQCSSRFKKRTTSFTFERICFDMMTLNVPFNILLVLPSLLTHPTEKCFNAKIIFCLEKHLVDIRTYLIVFQKH